MAAEAGQEDGPAEAVRRYIDAFNRADAEAMTACFATSGFILDGMAPHIWSGPSAAGDWWRDVLAESEHLGASGFRVELGAPLHDAVTGDSAYVVAPADMTFDVRGQRVSQTGATMTLALHRVDGQWRIAAWAWTKGSGVGTGDVAREEVGSSG